MNFKYLNTAFSMVVCAAVLTGCGKDEVAEVKPRAVVTYTVPAAEVQVSRSFSGQLSPLVGAELAFEVGGRVTEVLAQQGVAYEAGDVLASLDSTDFETRLNEAKSSLVQATQELRRVQRLFESGNASQSQLDGAIAQEQSARANFSLSDKQFKNSMLRMPYGGTIASVDIDAQQVVSPGQAVMRVQGEGGMQFKFGVPSNVVGLVKAGMALSVRVSDLNRREFAAKVKEVSPSSEQNTTYLVTAELSEQASGMRDGMDGEALLELPNPTGAFLSVPLSCVLGGSDGSQYVWAVVPTTAGEATVKRQKVELGNLLADGQTAVLAGLAAGDVILARGVHRVEEGMTVRLPVQ